MDTEMKAQMVKDFIVGRSCDMGATCYYNGEENCLDCPQHTGEGIEEEENKQEGLRILKSAWTATAIRSLPALT